MHKIECFNFIPGIFSLCKAALDKDYIIIVVTNQAGIGRGFYTKETFIELTESVARIFLNNNIPITKTYFCPHHPEYGLGIYKKYCKCRKPEPGMFNQAATEFGIEMKSSMMVGDKISDLRAAKTAGINNLVLFGDRASNFFSDDFPFYTRANLKDIVELIL